MKAGLNRTLAAAALAASCAVLCGAALAQQPARPDVESTLTASRVVSKDGRETLVAAERADPGDLLEYRAVYVNRGKAAVRNLEATLPVPEGMSLQPGTAQPAGALASLDRRTFEPMPIRRKVKLADGREEVREVPVSEYKALRWKVGELPAGQRASVAARMRLNPLETAAAPAAK